MRQIAISFDWAGYCNFFQQYRSIDFCADVGQLMRPLEKEKNKTHQFQQRPRVFALPRIICGARGRALIFQSGITLGCAANKKHLSLSREKKGSGWVTRERAKGFFIISERGGEPKAKPHRALAGAHSLAHPLATTRVKVLKKLKQITSFRHS